MSNATHLKRQILLLALVLLSLVALSQERDPMTNYVVKERMAQLQKALREDSIAQSKLKKNFPAVIETENGQQVLDRVDPAGNPLYLQNNYNQYAAKAVNMHLVYSDPSLADAKGQGMIVGVWDQSVAHTTHRELVGQVINKDGGKETADHSSHVTGIICAKGVRPNIEGAASHAKVWGYDWSNALPELAVAATQGLTISNHSYGMSNTNSKLYRLGKYDYTAQAYDQTAYAAPYLLPIKAAGNDRDKNLNTADGGYDLLSDGAVAKNVLVVGAVKYTATKKANIYNTSMSTYSSWGPTDDYRLKPDVTAPGIMVSCKASTDSAYGWMGGTSMATPLVSGVAAVLQQQYKSFHNGTSMLGSMTKALLINTALDRGNTGPDFQFGWGVVNASEAVRVIKSDTRFSQILKGDLKNGATKTYTVEYDGINPLKLSLVWTDPAASLDLNNYTVEDMYQATLVNDLDIRLIKGNKVYKPYTFDTTKAYNQVAYRGDNARDNVECIFENNLPAGTYQIKISHKGSLVDNKQQYSLIIDGQENPFCRTPNNFVVDTLANNKIKLSWNKKMSNLQTRIKVTSTITGAVNTYQVSGSSLVLADLDYNDNADLEVTQLLYNGSTLADSSNTVALNVQTPDKPCELINALNITGVTDSSISLQWNTAVYDASTIYVLEYKSVNDMTWTSLKGAYPSQAVTVTGLNQNTTYEFRIKEDCPQNPPFTYTQATTLPKISGHLGIAEVQVTATYADGANTIEVSSDKAIAQIEVSKMMDSKFEKVETLQGKTTYVDHKPTGNQSVYRLIVNTNNEKVEKIVSIQHSELDGSLSLNIQGETLEITSSDAKNLTVEIHNLMGQMIDNYTLENTVYSQIDLSKYEDNATIITLKQDGNILKSLKHIKR